MSGAFLVASSVVSFGAWRAISTLTVFGVSPPARRSSSATIAAVVAFVASLRPSAPAMTPKIEPDLLRRYWAETGFRATSFFVARNAFGMAASSMTGCSAPPGAVVNVIQLRTLAAGIFQRPPAPLTMTALPTHVAAFCAWSTSSSLRSGSTGIAAAWMGISGGAFALPTSATAFDWTAGTSKVQPGRAWSTRTPRGPIPISALTGRASSGVSPAAIAARSAASSNTTVGSSDAPRSASRTSPRARSTTLPSRPVDRAASTSAPTSARRANAL